MPETANCMTCLGHGWISEKGGVRPCAACRPDTYRRWFIGEYQKVKRRPAAQSADSAERLSVNEAIELAREALNVQTDDHGD